MQLAMFVVVGISIAAAGESKRRERIRSEAVLRESERRYQMIAQASHDAIWDWDRNSESVFWNEGLQRFGYETRAVERGIGWWQDRIHPDDRRQVAERLHALDSGSETDWSIEYRFRRADGSYAFVLERGRVLRDSDGRAVRMIGSMLDMSDRKEAEERLTIERARFEAVLTQLPSGVIIGEAPSGRLVLANERVRDILKHGFIEAEEVEEYTKYGAIHPDGRPYAGEEYPLARVISRGERIDGEELHYIRGDGERVTLRVSGAPVVGLDGTVIAGVVVFNDVTSQKRLQLRVSDQQQWLESVLNFMPVPLLFIEPGSGTVLFSNRAADELAGGDFPKGKAGSEYHTVYYCTDAEGQRIPDEQMPGVRVARGERLDAFEMDWHVDDTAHSVALWGDTLPAMHGHPATGIILFHDVGNLKQAAEMLRQTQSRLDTALDAGLTGTWHWDIVTDRVFCDENLARFFSVDAERAAQEGLPLEAFLPAVHPDDRPGLEAAIQSALEHRAAYEHEYRVVLPDGSLIWLATRGRVQCDEQGRPVSFPGVMMDITARKEAELQLRDREEQYRRIFESTSDALLIFDMQGRLIDVNPAACTMHGYTREELLSLNGTELVHPEDHPKFMNFVKQVSAGQDFHVEGRHIRKDGKTITAIVKGSSFSFGGQDALLAVLHDVTEERKAVEALREREELLRFALESTRIGQWELDTATGQARRSPLHDQIFGYDEPLEDWTYETFLHGHVHPDDREEVNRSFLRALESGLEWDFECRIIRADQEVRWIWAKGNTLESESGEASRMVGLVMDITERKNAIERERQLLAEAAISNAKFRAFFEQGPLFAGIVTLDGTFLETNRLSLEACGYTREQVVGKPFWEGPWWTPSAELQQTVKAASLQAAAGESFRAELPYYVADGSERVVEINIIPITDDEGNVLFVAPTGSDVTDRKRAETALRESEEKFRDLADNISQFAWMADETGQIFWYNRRWFDYTGSTLEETQGWGWESLNHPDHFERVRHGIQHSCSTGEPWEDTFPLRGKDGRYRWYLSRALPIRSDHGHIIRWFGTHTDVTEQIELQQELKKLADRLAEADRRKDEFLATLSHELRNPLAPIRMGLEAMKLTENDQGSHEQIRSTMERQTQQLITLVDDLLDVSRITRGKLELRKCRVELRSVVESAVEAAHPFIVDGGHELRVTLPDQPVLLDADPHRLAQVLSNLLNNAAKYTPENGRVWLTATRHDSEVRIQVKDNGIGIPDELQSAVFEMFAQLNHPEGQQRSGLGIGLTLVQSLVEKHSGRIEVHSEGEGKGTEFTITLPVASDVGETRGENDAEASGEPHGLRVLVVDDNRAAASMLSMVVRTLGNEVRTAFDGQEAVTCASEFQPHLVLMDIGMPVMDGYEAAAQIRRNDWGQNMTLVALTGWGRAEDKRRSLDAGFDHHLTKPADPAHLQSLFAECAARR